MSVAGSPDGTVDVSLSHAGEAVVVASTAAGRVGVDVEPEGATADLGLELAEWVAKEAVLKATGDGLRLPMERIRLVDGRVVAWQDRPDVVRRLRLESLTLAPPGHLARLALLDVPASRRRSPSTAGRTTPPDAPAATARG